MKHLYSKLRTGLGNRCQHIFSAMRIAEVYGADYFVDWKQSFNCYADYYDLFKTKINLVNVNIFGIQNGNFITQDLLEQNKIVLNKACIMCLENEILIDSYQYMREKFLSFELNDFISEEINKFDINDAIGVHVRRGDAPSFRQISEQKYYNYLDNKKDKIFLATEDSVVKINFINRYKNRIITTDNYNEEPKRTQQAFIDMILLSKTKYILTGESTFSKFASIVGNTNRVLIRKNKKD